MIPVELLYILICLAMALSVYAVWQYESRIYGNIVFGGFISSTLWFYLAANIITGNVFYTYSDMTDTLVDVPFFWIFVLFGVVMSIYTLLLAWEAITENKRAMEVPDI